MKRFWTLSILLILLVSLAACGGAATPAPAPAKEEPAKEEPAPAEEMVIKLGAAVSESGKYAREGKDTRQGYNLWLDWVNNEKGGIKVGDDMYNVEIVYYDDEGDPDTTAKLVETLITEDEVDFLLGPYSSGLTKSASAISEKYDMIMVEGNGASESLFERGFKNLFAVLTPAGNYTQSALQMLAEKGAKTVVIAYEDTAFPTSVAAGAEKWAAEYGLEVLAVETYPKDVADVSGIMTKFRDMNPDVFVGGGHFNDALLFTRAAKELDFNPKAMVITVGPSNPEFAAEMGADADYIIGPTQWASVMSYEDEWLGTAAEYAERYEEMWGETPTYQAAESTATALALMAAIEQAGSLETADVRDALNALDITTFYGPISFDETGKNAGKPMGAVQVQSSEIKVIAPGGAAEVDLIYPMPPWSERDEAMAAAPAEEPMEVAGTIKLGAAVSESGKYAREGKDTRQGYNLWLDWVNNEKGGIQVGDQLYSVEIVYYDDEGDPDTTAKLIETLITEDEVDFLLGPYSSGLTKSASAISEKYDMIMVEGNGASESLFERGFQNLFAVLTPAGNYTQSALQMLAEKGAKTVVIAYEDTAFPTSVAAGAEKWAAEYGLEVLAVETYPKDVADVSGIMTKFRDLEPDIFVGGGHFNDALLFTRAAKELDFNPKATVITVGPSNPKFAEEMGADADYIIGPTQWASVMSYEDEWLGTAAEYQERYVGMWGEVPTYQAAESTATALALMAAIEQAGSLETADVRDALNALDIVTFYGPISFDETGKNAGKPMGAIQVQSSEIKVIAPSGAAEADLIYPTPPWSERGEAMAAPAMGDADLIMSFVPSGDTEEILASGDTLAAMIAERTGYNVTSNVATSYAAVIEAMGAGNAQIGWLNTFGYVLANEKYGVDVALVAVRFGSTSYKGQIITKADSGIETITDLAGKTFCRPDPLSTSGWIIPSISLAAAGLDPAVDIEVVDVGSHNNVVSAVYNGECAAGATYVDARSSVEDDIPDVKDVVVVITESADIPNDTISFAAGVPAEVRENVVNALLDIAETEEGQAALEDVLNIAGLEPVDDSFYDEFRIDLDASGYSVEDFQ